MLYGLVKSRCFVKDAHHAVFKESRRLALGEGDEIASAAKGIRTKTRLSIRENLDQFATVHGVIFVIVVYVAAPSGYRAVDFDSIDASFSVFMRNIRIVSGVNHIARSVAPVDDDLSFASLDGEF